MKKIFIIIVAIFLGCSGRIDNAQVEELGKVQIGPNLYLKKFDISYSGTSCDKVYILVNDRDELVAGTSTTYQVGKSYCATTVR